MSLDGFGRPKADPWKFDQPQRIFAVRTRDGRWLRANKAGRPVLKWSWEAGEETWITDNPDQAADVAAWCRMREETAYMTEIVPELDEVAAPEVITHQEAPWN
jgi:hypothetical protein